MILNHLLPLHGITFLVGEALGVNAVAQNHRKLSIGNGAKHISPHHNPVVHADGHVPLDPHSIPNLTAHFEFSRLCPLTHARTLLVENHCMLAAALHGAPASIASLVPAANLFFDMSLARFDRNAHRRVLSG